MWKLCVIYLCSPMPIRIIAQPLPQDLRNCSFRGQDCSGWDFSGRDIRGCDFRSAELNGANFQKVIAGRSQKQIDINIAVAVAVAVAVVFVVVIADADVVANSVVVAFVFSVIVAFAGAGAVVVAATNSVAVAVAVAAAVAAAAAVAVAVAAAAAVAVAGLRAIQAFSQGRTVEGLILSAVAILCFLFSRYVLREAVREFKNVTGTNFKGANLTGTDFSYATLNNCSFENANTTFVNWSHAEGSRSTIDFTRIRMQLLTSRKGNSCMYPELDLSDRHLAGIELIKANLSSADVTRSNLRSADLTLANLTNLRAGDADFSDATLTGACIQNWTINSGTRFDRVICEHIFLTPDRNPQNRRPLSGSFEPGDFALLVDKFADSLDFILRRGTDPIAFKQSLNQFQQDNPEARIKAMVDLDADRVLVQSTVPEGADKVRIYEGF
jgi:uncharacterized protein YjbI with pentapeptide repeats